MRRKILVVLALVAPSLAFAGAKRHKKEPIPFCLPASATATVANGSIGSIYSTVNGTITNVLLYQASQGNGTSVAVDVRDAVSSALLVTAAGVATVASGANVKTDAAGEIALPSGWTRPALGSVSRVSAGQRIYVYTVETGTYSTHAFVQVCLTIQPD